MNRDTRIQKLREAIAAQTVAYPTISQAEIIYDAVFEGPGSFLPVASDVQETAHTDDEREASLDSERLRQIAEWLRMEIGHEDTAKRVDLIADRHDRLAAGFHRSVQGEPSDALEVMTAEKEKWRIRCAEETIAWTEATKRADRAEAFWHASEDECWAVRARLDALLRVQGDAKLSGNSVQGELSDAQLLAQGFTNGVNFIDSHPGPWGAGMVAGRAEAARLRAAAETGGER